MTSAVSESLAIAAFLLLAMSVGGVVHVAWLRSANGRLLLAPVDCGARFRGRRLFGDNKRLRGFIALPLGTAAAFVGVAALRESLPDAFADSLWPLSLWRYAGTGFAAGFAFMLAELPNSFFKRQLGVAPGAVPANGWQRKFCLLLDRIDSALGVMIAVSLLVPVPVMTWVWVLLFGPGLHAAFSALLYRAGVKERVL